MEPGRCLHLLPVTGLALAGALALGGSPLFAAGPGEWPPAACGSGGAPPGEGAAWYRLDPVLDGAGTLSGTRLVAGGPDGPGRAMLLEPEAFASGPVQGRVIVGEDNGSRSVLRALDPERGCATGIASERESVVRSAAATGDGRALYEHRVDRRTRADLGVWRRELAGWQAQGPARRVLDALPGDPQYGPTFTTGLDVMPDGSLVASSCGMVACRTRVLAPDGTVRAIGPTGPALGAAGGTVVARAACTGYPCAIVAHDADGTRRVLAAGAHHAALVGDGGGTLVIEDEDGRLRLVDVRTGTVAPLDAAGVVPVAGGSLATSGASATQGEVVLAPGGRVTGNAAVRRVQPAGLEVAP